MSACAVQGKRALGQHTTMPSLTFSPPSFSSTASSRTMFRNTCVEKRQQPLGSLESRETNIVSTEDANNLAAAVQLDKEPLVEVLFTPSSAPVRGGGWEEACGRGRCHSREPESDHQHGKEGSYLLEFWLCGRHGEFLKQSVAGGCGAGVGAGSQRAMAKGARCLWTRVRLAKMELEISTGPDWPDASRVELGPARPIR